MHWYLQLSCLVFIPSPVLPSSLFMPHNHCLELQLRAKGAKASHFWHRQERPQNLVCVCDAVWVLNMGKFQPWQWWKMLAKFWGILCGSPVSFLWSFSSWTQWFWSSDSMVLEVFPSFSDYIPWLQAPLEVLWSSHPRCFKLTHPGLYIIFTAFPQLRVTPELILGNLCWLIQAGTGSPLPKPHHLICSSFLGELRLEQHWLTQVLAQTKPPALPQLCFNPYLMNSQLLMQIKAVETLKGYL